ncbi:DUF6486 family protein [Phocaeicola sartorii]
MFQIAVASAIAGALGGWSYCLVVIQ